MNTEALFAEQPIYHTRVDLGEPDLIDVSAHAVGYALPAAITSKMQSTLQAEADRFGVSWLSLSRSLMAMAKRRLEVSRDISVGFMFMGSHVTATINFEGAKPSSVTVGLRGEE